MYSGGKSVESNSWSSVVVMSGTLEETGMENLMYCGGVELWVRVWWRLCGDGLSESCESCCVCECSLLWERRSLEEFE